MSGIYFRPRWLQAVLNMQVPAEHSKEVNDCKNLVKTLVMGIESRHFTLVDQLLYISTC